MADLISLPYCLNYLPNFNSNDNAALGAIISACSATVEKYCNRTFAITTYDELISQRSYTLHQKQRMYLKNFPITQITRLATNPNPVIYLKNTLADRATVRVDSTKLYTTSVTNGVTTSLSYTLANYATLNDLATAINLVNGWTVTTLNPYGSWPATDIRGPQGVFNAAKMNAALLVHVDDVADYLIEPETGILYGWWSRGINWYRCIYQAGFATIPLEVQQATAELCVLVYRARGLNENLQSETIGQYTYSIQADRSMKNLSPASFVALNKYKVMPIPESR